MVIPCSDASPAQGARQRQPFPVSVLSNTDALTATACALGYYGLAGEEAARVSQGPGSFQVALYDALYNLSEETMMEKLKIRHV